MYGLSTLAAGSKPITYLSVKEADHHHLADHRHHGENNDHHNDDGGNVAMESYIFIICFAHIWTKHSNKNKLPVFFVRMDLCNSGKVKSKD